MNDYLTASWIYKLSQFMVGSILRIFYHFKVEGVENIPSDKGCLLVANHVSFLDPPVVACSVYHRGVCFMARDTLSNTWLGKWYFNGIGAVALDRTKGDVGALRKAISLLKEGRTLGFFPEGTRSPDGELKTAKAGVGFLVFKGHVPVVPAYIDGTFKALPKNATRPKLSRISIRYGQPIMPDDLKNMGTGKEAYEKIGMLIMSKIAELKPKTEQASSC